MVGLPNATALFIAVKFESIRHIVRATRNADGKCNLAFYAFVCSSNCHPFLNHSHASLRWHMKRNALFWYLIAIHSVNLSLCMSKS